MRFLFLETMNGVKGCELWYASCVAKRIAKEISRLGHIVLEIERPTAQDAVKAIREFNPDVVWWVGHGNKGVTTLERLSVFISSSKCPNNKGDVNLDILSGRIANALSCLTASCLGAVVTEYGAKAYYGYEKEFWFMWCGCPTQYGCACGAYNPWKPEVRDEILKIIMECMHEANLYFTLGIAQGMTPEEAFWYSIDRFNYWINVLEKIEPISDREAALIASAIRLLEIDRSIARLCKGGVCYIPKRVTPTPKILRIDLRPVAALFGHYVEVMALLLGGVL